MTESIAQRDPVEELAEEFMARLRRGERPAVSEYAAAHPELADEIRDLFPALIVMEEVKPAGTEPHATIPGPDAPPEQLGDYRILREVARGGMGVVYEAEQVALGRHVALKVLPAQVGSDALRLLRFRREARSAARLHHTNIVPVFDVGSVDGVHYYAMQFIQGQGLDEVLRELHRLRSGTKPTDIPAADLTVSLAEGLRTGVFDAAPFVPVPKLAGPRLEPSAILTGPVSHYFRSVARLGVQAAEALAYAHGQRVLHRDVKPSNLLLDRQGTLWLTDFGLAKDDGDDLTRTGDIVGTLRYMAPERFKGVSDPRTDVYALGATLYELLTLRPAYDEADRVLLVRQIAQDAPPRPRAVDPTIPRDLETIVLKAIEKEPARRYATAADMAGDLRRFLTDRPIKARRASWREQAWRWCRRNPSVAVSLSAAFAFLVLLVAGLSISGLLIWQAKQDADTARRAAERSLGEAEQSLYFQRIALADREFQANNVTRGEELLGLCPEHLRGWEWHYLNRNRGRLPKHWALPQTITRHAGLSPDGGRAVLCGLRGMVYLLNLKNGQVIERQAHGADSEECVAAFSPDGRFLVTADSPATGNTRVKFWDPTTLCFLQEWEYPHGGILPFAISPDGEKLVTASQPKVDGEKQTVRVDVWELTTGRHLAEVPDRHTDSVLQLTFSPDSRQIASASPDGVVNVSDAGTGNPIHRFRYDRNAGYLFWCVAFSPDGRRLAAGYGDEVKKETGGVLLWDLSTGESFGAVKDQIVMGVALDHKGRIFTCGVDGTLRVWDLQNGQELISARGHIDVVRCLGLTPGGHQLVTFGLDRVVRVWDAAPLRDGEQWGDELRTLCQQADGVSTVRFLPDGQHLVIAGADGTVRRLPLKSGEGDILARNDRVEIGVSATGRWLAVLDLGTKTGRIVETADTKTHRTLERLGPGDDTFRLQFSSDDKLLASGFGNTVYVWDLESGELRRLVGHNYHVYSVAFHPGRRPLLASASTAGEVIVWDPVTGKPLAKRQHPAACAVAFSPDGQRMATGGWDRVIRIWNTEDDDPQKWKEIDSFEDPTGNPNVVVFSPDGKQLAWGGTDSGVKVWQLGTKAVETLRGHRHWVWDVSFSPDGQTLASASRDGTVKLWPNPFSPGGRP